MQIEFKNRFSSLVIILLLTIFSINNLRAQNSYLAGPTTANVNDIKNYYLYNAYDIEEYTIYWYADGIIQGQDYGVDYVDIKFDYSGVNFVYVEFEDFFYNFYWEELIVNVTSTGPTNPPSPTVQSSALGSVTLVRTGSPPSGVTWYWQSGSSDTNTTLGSGSTKVVTLGSSYYIRARNNSGVWSTGSGGVSFTIPSIPSITFPTCVDLTGNASPSQLNNFVHVLNPLTENGDSGAMQESIQYFDGLGRGLQSNAYKASGDGLKDIITPVVYDDFGRQAKDYLPFAQANNGGIETNGSNIANYTNYYGTTEANYVFSLKNLEASPLSRILEQGAPGQAWAVDVNSDTDKTIKFEYKSNVTDEVRLWTVDGSGNLASSSYYMANELYKSIVKDENWTTGSTDHTTEEFKDKQGRVVLKKTYGKSVVGGTATNNVAHETYYVYDGYGNLSYVLPPLAEGTINSSISGTILANLCYQYTYDDRNRLIEKQIPGKGKESIVYDVLDRPVLTQDAIQAENGSREWLFTKYDGLGRVIYTGIYTHSSVIDQAAMQTHFSNTNNLDTELYETKQTSSGTLGIYYSNSDYPSSSLEVLTVNYYDNYTFDKTMLGSIPSSVQGATINTAVARGLPTGSKVKVLDKGKWITTATYYDNNARAIYTTSDNDYLDTQDKIELALDFRGKATKTVSNHVKGTNAAIVVTEDFDYDDQERLKTQKHQITGKSQELVASNNYDELGQLISKGVGNVSSSGTRLQTVNYEYNIRGWLTKINDVEALGNDLFSFGISYNNVKDDIYNQVQPLYNGNISETYWKTSTDNYLRGYGYRYDALNRILDAWYEEPTHPSKYVGYNNTRFVTYDKNGNITQLKRYGSESSNTLSLMDQLYYTYDSGNKLQKVVDNGNDSLGFKDGTNTGDDYTYDQNGNMVSDANKGITNIDYNHLNLPSKVYFGSNNIEYFYDATGVKLEKIVTNGSSLTYTRYAGNYIYEDTNTTPEELKFFNHSEGFIDASGSGYDYVYQYKDHLGNVRLNYKNTGSTSSPSLQIQEENHYYPFGLKHKGYGAPQIGNDHKYGYNGKEEQDDVVGGSSLNWHDFGARNYDAALGRWMNLDPLASKYMKFSPYNFTLNNPIYFVDPDGKRVDTSGIYAKDDDDNYLHPELIEAFESFANTKEGQSFIADFAEEGQTIAGKYYGTSGKYHNDKIDIGFGAKVLKDKYGNESTSMGRTEVSSENGRTNISFFNNTSQNNHYKADYTSSIIFGSSNEIKYARDKFIYLSAEKIVHETFIHGEYILRDIYDNGIRDGSFVPLTLRGDKDHHKSLNDWNDGKGRYRIDGIEVMRALNKKYKQFKSDEEIWNQMWNFGGF